MATDAGASWADISGDLPDAPASPVALDGDAIVVASEVGVFVGVDGGSSWRRYGTGLPNAIAVERAGRRVVVTTHARPRQFRRPAEP